ncbi:Phosphate transport system regulatory protein [gamma proteobacterium HdN1]|nr:Phosphate transport system regulatory protein [gamma proteobacterium HdN1]
MPEELKLHISKRFNRDLATLVSQLLQMGGTVELQLKSALDGLLNGEVGLVQQAKELEEKVDQFDLILGEACAQMLVLRQPAASDLRMTLAINKCVSDLERMGDEAHKIARVALPLMEDGQSLTGFVEVRHIGQHVMQMLHDVLHAFSRQDISLALHVKSRDEQVDIEYRSAMRTLMTFMMEEPQTISRIMNVIWVLRSLERIGDHACNIAEQIVYMVQGRDIRHASKEEVAKLLNQLNLSEP